MSEHKIVVVGEWHNDNTGGFSLWCETCDWSWDPPESAEENGGSRFCVQDQPTPWSTVAQAAETHLAETTT